MKKIALVIAVVLGISGGMSAQTNGLFGYGETPEEQENESVAAWYALTNDQDVDNGLFEVLREVYNKSELPNLPGHNEDTNQNAPLGSGVLLLVGFGVVYARKKRRE